MPDLKRCQIGPNFFSNVSRRSWMTCEDVEEDDVLGVGARDARRVAATVEPSKPSPTA